MPPGADLAAALAAIDSESISSFDRIIVLRASQRQVSHYQAESYKQIAALYAEFIFEDKDFELAWDSASAEIAVALNLTRRSSECELDLALEIWSRLPAIGQMLSAGKVDLRRARVLARGTCHVNAEAASEIVEELVDRVAEMTATQLEAALRKRCIAHDPEAAKKRYEDAVAGRRVLLDCTVEGTAHLSGLDLPPDLAVKALARICSLAEAARVPGDNRTIDQRRADVYLDLLLEGGEGKKPGVVHIHVDLATLAQLNDDPGEVVGYGPVIADIARQIADQQTKGEWRWTLDDETGSHPLANGLIRRRPTAAQRRRVEAVNPTCIFPGCRAASIASDLDHQVEWAKGGPTRTDHLNPFCRHHHVVRHDGRWRYRPLPNGDYLFTSRTGHRYTTSGRSP
jgi:hypothetical protein